MAARGSATSWLVRRTESPKAPRDVSRRLPPWSLGTPQYMAPGARRRARRHRKPTSTRSWSRFTRLAGVQGRRRHAPGDPGGEARRRPACPGCRTGRSRPRSRPPSIARALSTHAVAIRRCATSLPPSRPPAHPELMVSAAVRTADRDERPTAPGAYPATSKYASGAAGADRGAAQTRIALLFLYVLGAAQAVRRDGHRSRRRRGDPRGPSSGPSALESGEGFRRRAPCRPRPFSARRVADARIESRRPPGVRSWKEQGARHRALLRHVVRDRQPGRDGYEVRPDDAPPSLFVTRPVSTGKLQGQIWSFASTGEPDDDRDVLERLERRSWYENGAACTFRRNGGARRRGSGRPGRPPVQQQPVGRSPVMSSTHVASPVAAMPVGKSDVRRPKWAPEECRTFRDVLVR